MRDNNNNVIPTPIIIITSILDQQVRVLNINIVKKRTKRCIINQESYHKETFSLSNTMFKPRLKMMDNFHNGLLSVGCPWLRIHHNYIDDSSKYLEKKSWTHNLSWLRIKFQTCLPKRAMLAFLIVRIRRPPSILGCVTLSLLTQ